MFTFRRKKKPDQAAVPAPRPIPRSRLKPSLLSLEQRLMFDAAAAATVAEAASEQVAQDQAESAASSEPSADGTASEPTDSQDLLQAIASYAPGETTTEVVFIDPTVPNYQDLLSGMDPNIEVIMLDGGQDGMEQIAASLAGRTGIDAIHIISHGAEGQLQLGTGTLTQESMTGAYADELAIIQQALSEQADILIYGCNFSDGTAGQDAAALLSQLTGADVAASTDATGFAGWGGDWILETQTGTIETAVAVTGDSQANWQALLAAPTITSGAGPFTMDENTTVAATVTATDPESDPLIYSISGGVDAAQFSIDANTGVLSFLVAPDFETPTDFGGDNVYDVQVGVSDGVLGSPLQNMSITVTNVNEAPRFGETGTGWMQPSGLISGYDIGERTMAIQSDGKIMVADTTGTNFGILRFNSDGTRDTSFGTNGVVSTDFSGQLDQAYSVAVQADGKIIVGGYSSVGGGVYDFALARYNSDGSLDTSFNGTGKLTINMGSVSDYARSIAVQSDGKILIAGSMLSGSNNFAVARVNADGTLDTSFGGGDGIVTTDIGGNTNDTAYTMYLQADGKIVLGGTSANDFALVRYNADGSLDAGFGTGGKVVTPIGGGNDYGYGLTADASGKLILVGSSFNGSSDDIALVRYNTDGSLDGSFGTGGKVTTSTSANSDVAYSVRVQGDGKILVGGTSRGGATSDFALLRYNADGTLDTSFNGTGIVTADYEGARDEGYGIALQADGKIVMAGVTDVFIDDHLGVTRFNSDGSVDLPFGASGLLSATPTYTEGGSAVVLDADVTIVDAELSAANNYNGATLTLARNGGASAEDVFSATGTLASIAATSGNVVVGGTTIGAYTNSGGTLAFTFNSNATNALVNSAVRQIAYSNSSDTPPASAQINWTISDGNAGAQGPGGALTGTGSITVTITAVNDAPTIANLSGDSLSYSEGAGAVVIEQSGNALVADVDSANFDTGTLTVSIPAGGDSAEDVLSIRNEGAGAGQIGVSGSNVTYAGVTIGTVTGGSGGSALVITLNSSATPTAVTALVKNITYENTDTAAPTTGARTVRYVLTDGDGGTSANYDTTVSLATPLVTVPGPLLPGQPVPPPPGPLPPTGGPVIPKPTEGGGPTLPPPPPHEVPRVSSPPVVPRAIPGSGTLVGPGHLQDGEKPVVVDDERGLAAWTSAEPMLNFLREAADQVRTLAKAPEIPAKLSEVIVKELDAMTESLAQAMEERQDEAALVAASAAGVSLVLSAGYLMWVLRGGWLLASFLATMPTWRSFDVLPVLTRKKRDDELQPKPGSPKSQDRNERRIEELFDPQKGRAA